MNKTTIITALIVVFLLGTINANSQDSFAITLKVDSAIASEPQKVYLYSQIEKQMQLHDSLGIDSVHRVGTLHGLLQIILEISVAPCAR